MHKSIWYYVWAGLFLLTAGLGFVSAEEPALRFCCRIAAIIFFVPPVMLLIGGDARDRKNITILSAVSLSLTLVCLIISVVSAKAGELTGTILHAILTVVSAPMVCSGIWVVSLFLWACLLFGSIAKGAE